MTATETSRKRPLGVTTGTPRRPTQHLADQVLHHDLVGESVALIREAREAPAGRAAKTLAKHGSLHTVITALRAGTTISEHRTHAPVRIMAVAGRVRVHAAGQTIDLAPGELLSLTTGVTHDVEALDDASFVITVAQPESGGEVGAA